MSENSILSRYASQRQADPKGGSDESEVLEDLGAFGFLRGARDRSIMLELRFRDGRIMALSYAGLDKIDFDPSGEIQLHFPPETVTITGRNLNTEARPNVRLFAGLVRHRVPWIQEFDEPAAIAAARDAVVIDSIEVK